MKTTKTTTKTKTTTTTTTRVKERAQKPSRAPPRPNQQLLSLSWRRRTVLRSRCCGGGWSLLSATKSASGSASGCCKWDCSACAFASNSAASARGCCSRCCVLQQRCEDGALDAAVVFADRRAVPFFNKHGFNDDPILNARYAEVLEPCARWSQQLPPPISGAHSSWASQEPLGQQLAA